MLDRLTSMSVFLKATDAGSFAAASEALGVSPQMIARHVAQLEDRLGARLLNRTTRRQSLTELGAAYYQRCKLILADVETADSLAAEIHAVPRGRLRVTAPLTFGAQRLMPMITRYLRDHMQVEIDLVLTDRCTDLIDEGYEAAFRIGPLLESRFAARTLSPYRLVACASPDYLAQRGVPAVPADLAKHECLTYVYPGRTTDAEWRFTREAQAQTVRVRSRLHVNDAKALLAAALDDFGVVLGPEDILSPWLAAGKLVQVLPGYDAPSRPMHLLFSPDRRPTPKLRSFIDAAVTEFSSRGAAHPS
ncbi:LysR family transcriptional regulator [Robbsia sp. Bb-Pol-6]|uniref:LysR family transcriptional regulator n=1 Tax=Robbsia betulipollinis TaxID=2981849 RepID=A0ABT3ZJ36_9BURK|nr:LysR family transcriptional regulator [Robbsia betulipollinis]MCY0386515.1 LysR family transcriptional regulator [Robbsia betulipollinis]